MTKVGTSHFQSLKAARSYYNKQGYDKEYVQDAIAEGAIVIGKPPLKADERLSVEDGRYAKLILEKRK